MRRVAMPGGDLCAEVEDPNESEEDATDAFFSCFTGTIEDAMSGFNCTVPMEFRKGEMLSSLSASNF